MSTNREQTNMNKLLQKIMRLKNKEYFILKGDFYERQYESYETALLKMFDDAEKVITTGDENPFSVYKKKMFNKTFYLISNALDDSYVVLRDDTEELEKKLINSETELFTKIEELLGLNDEYQILDEALGVTLYYPDLSAIDKLFDVKEEEDFIDFHGDKIQIKYAKNSDCAYVEIPYQYFYKIYQYVLESDYKKVNS